MATDDVISKINLLQGTNSVHDLSRGNTLPIIARPWGMHHWTPQTGKSPWTFNSSHSRLWGFRLTHQPSPWMRDYGSFMVQPFTGACAESIEHQNSAYCLGESVLQPHFMSTKLLRYGIRVRMTPTERGAVFIFSKTSAAPLRLRFEFDGEHAFHALPGGRMISGTSADSFEGEELQNFGLHFVAETSAPITAVQRTAGGAYVEFPAGADTVELRVAASFISHEIARVSLAREVLGKSLEHIRAEGAQIWSSYLRRIEITANSAAQERTFYSCLYRCLLFPRFLDEVDAQGRTLHYSPYDGEVHAGSLCADTGFWDGYRTLYPLLTLVYPDVLSRMLGGMTNICQESGWAPKWPSPGLRDCMIGTHFDAVAADAAVKGVTGWDMEAVYGYLRRNATEPSNTGHYGRKGLEEYLALGYVAADVTPYGASCTLDYAYDDFCIAAVASKLGRRGEAEELTRRSRNYQHVFDPAVGFMRGRLADGTWLEPFSEFTWGGPFIEGGPWQHAFNVPHDFPGLASLYGGNAGLCRKLDAMLNTPPHFEIGTYPYEIHEMTEMAVAPFGQYAHSNQPVHNFLFLYALAGEPAKTEYWVQRVLNELYTPDAFPGDEDNGQMSAWYIWATLGLYPCCPGQAEYLHFTPSVKAATIQTPATAFQIMAPDVPCLISHEALLKAGQATAPRTVFTTISSREVEPLSV